MPAKARTGNKQRNTLTRREDLGDRTLSSFEEMRQKKFLIAATRAALKSSAWN